VGYDDSNALLLDIIPRDLLTRIGCGIRRGSVRSQLRILHDSGEMSVIDINEQAVS